MSLAAVPAPARESREDPAASFDELFRQYAPRVKALAERRLPGRHVADDVVQETFLRAFRSFGGIDPNRPVWPWLRTVATNVCVDMLRQRRHPERDVALDADEVAIEDTRTDPGELHLAGQRRRSIATALAAVNPRQRRVVVLKDIEGWETEEVAQLEGISVDAVKSTLKRGRQSFRATYLALADRQGLLGGVLVGAGSLAGRLRRLAVRLRGGGEAGGLLAPAAQVLPLAIVATLAGGVIAINAHVGHGQDPQDISAARSLVAAAGDSAPAVDAPDSPVAGGGAAGADPTAAGTGGPDKVIRPLGPGSDVKAAAAVERVDERMLVSAGVDVHFDGLPLSGSHHVRVNCTDHWWRDAACDGMDAAWAVTNGDPRP